MIGSIEFPSNSPRVDGLLWVTSDGLVSLATGPLYSPTADVGADI